MQMYAPADRRAVQELRVVPNVAGSRRDLGPYVLRRSYPSRSCQATRERDFVSYSRLSSSETRSRFVSGGAPTARTVGQTRRGELSMDTRWYSEPWRAAFLVMLGGWIAVTLVDFLFDIPETAFRIGFSIMIVAGLAVGENHQRIVRMFGRESDEDRAAS